MKIFIYIQLIISLFLSCNAFGQNEVSGILINRKTKKSVPFATIGLKNSNRGTITNSNGFFELESTTKKDTLIISCLGFKKIEIPIYKLNDTLLINEKTELLPEVVIGKTNYSNKISLGAKNRHKKLLYEFLNYKNGSEIGRIIKVEKPIIIDKVTFFVKEISFDKIKLRLNFYSIDNDSIPNKKFDNNIIFDVTKKGKIKLDISKYKVKAKDDFLITIEALETLGNGTFSLSGEYHFDLDGMRKTCFYRANNKDLWKKSKPHQLYLKLTAQQKNNTIIVNA